MNPPDNLEVTADAPPRLAEVAPPVPPTRLSEDLTTMRDELAGDGLTIGEIESSLKGRGITMLLMILALPFCVLPIPGLSMPFGAAVFLIGFRLMLGQRPWLPMFVRRTTFSPERSLSIINGAIRLCRAMERVGRPRMHFMQTWPGMTNLVGFGIASAGLLLLLPLPVPFSNTLPAWAVVLLAGGMVERDGLFVLAGHLLSVAAWAYVVAISIFGKAGVEKLWHMVTG
jgi:hypothetical protein